MCESSKKSVAGLLTANSSSEGLNPEELSTTEQREAEEGDLSRKDKVKMTFIHFSSQIRLLKRYTLFYSLRFFVHVKHIYFVTFFSQHNFIKFVFY